MDIQTFPSSSGWMGGERTDFKCSHLKLRTTRKRFGQMLPSILSLSDVEGRCSLQLKAAIHNLTMNQHHTPDWPWNWCSNQRSCKSFDEPLVLCGQGKKIHDKAVAIKTESAWYVYKRKLEVSSSAVWQSYLRLLLFCLPVFVIGKFCMKKMMGLSLFASDVMNNLTTCKWCHCGGCTTVILGLSSHWLGCKFTWWLAHIDS